MKLRQLLTRAAVAGLLACPDPAEAVDLSGDVGLVSDYRFRGMTLSNGQPAAQASLSLESESGPYVGAWASTIREPGSKTSAEIDLYAGYEVEFSEAVGLDFVATYYAYPWDWGSNYLEASANLKLTSGIFETDFGLGFVPKQPATEDESGRRHRSSYAYVQSAVAVPGTPIKLTVATGYERGFFDETEHGGKWDWSAGVVLILAQVRAGVAYIGTDAPGEDGCLVASVFFEF